MNTPDDIRVFFNSFKETVVGKNMRLERAIIGFAGWSSMPKEGAKSGSQFWGEVHAACCQNPELALIMIRNSNSYKKWLAKSKYVPPKPRSVQLSITKMRKLCS